MRQPLNSFMGALEKSTLDTALATDATQNPEIGTALGASRKVSTKDTGPASTSPRSRAFATSLGPMFRNSMPRRSTSK